MFQGSSFKQFKAYLSRIENFDELYIIQQGGRGFGQGDVVAALERAIARDAESVFKANESLWRSLGIREWPVLETMAKNKDLSTSSLYEVFRNIIKITK